MIKNRVSMYDQLEYYQEVIAPKYLDLENLDASRVGLYGYLNEILADTTGDIVKETSVLFNELFIKKAQIPESILAYASQYRIENINARPAKMDFYIGIREDMILDNSITDSSGNSYFIIDSDSEIFVEDNFKYMLDYDIKINIRKSARTGYIYSAQYIMNKENKISDIKSPYLKVVKQRVNNSYYLFIIVTARQMDKVVMESKIFSDDILSYITKDFVYEGTLADFNVYYKANDNSEYEQISKLIIDSPPVDDKFCYYQYLNENTISISFSTLARHFRPDFNSTIKLEIFTSDGTKANFSYKGDNVRMNLKSEIYDYKKVIAIAQSISDSIEGKDRYSYTDLKEIVSYYASTAQNISTTIDLDKYFSRSSRDSQSKLTFVKKRDDILDRLFGAYILMKDQNNCIIPSNTLDMHINDTMFDQKDDNLKRYVIKAGSKIAYLPDSYDVEKKSGEFLESDKYRYSNPYVLVLNKEPLSVSYYLNSINKSYITEFKYINDCAFYQFITNKVKIFRDAINGDDKYVLTFKLVPNLSDIDFDFANLGKDDKFISSNDKIKVFAQYSNKSNEVSYYNQAQMIGYDKKTKEMSFKIELSTDDYISATNKLKVLNCVKKNGSDELLKEVLIEATQMVFSLFIFYKEEEENVQPHGYEHIFVGSTGYQLTNSYELSENVNLINDMTDIMRSTVIDRLYDKVKMKQLGTKYEYIIRNVPLVNYNYIKNKKLAKDYVQNIFTNAKDIRESLKLITNNFNIDLKMYNTYGKSRYFYILGEKSKTLDNINLTLSMDIHMNPASISDVSVQYDIVEFIKNYIEETNDNNNLYVSNLMNALEENFSEIKYITFNHINDYDYSVQSIEKNFPTYNISDRGNLMNFVPEFINVSKNYSEDSVDADYNLDIKFK